MPVRYICFMFLLVLIGCGAPSITVPPRVLVLTPEHYTFGGGTSVEALIEAAGGVNAAHYLADYSQIADWQILEMAPDIILFSQTWTPAQIENWAEASVYADLPAIRNHQLHYWDFSLAEADVHASFDEYVGVLQGMLVE